MSPLCRPLRARPLDWSGIPVATASALTPSRLASLAQRSILTLFLADSQDANTGTSDTEDGDHMDGLNARDGVTTTTATTTTAAGSAAVDARETAIRAQGLDGILLSGKTVRLFRQRLGVSAAQLAEHIGYSRGRVHAWEAGE